MANLPHRSHARSSSLQYSFHCRSFPSVSLRPDMLVLEIEEEWRQTISGKFHWQKTLDLHPDHGGGGGFFHSKGTWGCATRKGILFWTSSLAKGVLFSNFSRVKSRQGYAFWQFWSKKCENSVIFLKKTHLFKNFGPENTKIWQVCLENANSEHFWREN